MTKRVLVIYYTQSGQLSDVIHSITDPLLHSDNIELVFEPLQPAKPYPFPWPFLTFFDTFPETVYDDPQPIEPLSNNATGDFDLVILAYQVWFLSPSQPVTAFLQSDQAKQLLRNKPVITVIGCRNMWLMAQEKIKKQLGLLDATLIDNVVLTDPAHSAATFFSTPIWVLTGNKGPYFNGLIPEAGLDKAEVKHASRFGDAIAKQLPERSLSDTQPMLEGLGAVSINDRLIASETVALRSFRIWGGLLRAAGKPGTLLRRIILLAYIVFLICLILTVVPITACIKKLLAPLMVKRIAKQRLYFSEPSGEDTQKMDSL